LVPPSLEPIGAQRASCLTPDSPFTVSRSYGFHDRSAVVSFFQEGLERQRWTVVSFDAPVTAGSHLHEITATLTPEEGNLYFEAAIDDNHLAGGKLEINIYTDVWCSQRPSEPRRLR
jgi:hypothetical protein